MGMSINTNIGSLNAQSNLNSVSKSLGSTMERVSSGLRINSAKDDAAGLSIASRIGAQVSGMGQAARNVGSAMLLAKTAESDLGLMREGLVRMRTLAVQAADGSYSAAERVKMNNEFVEIRKNIESISNTSNFNGKKLLDGSMQNQQFQVGANANETIAMSVGSVSTNKLGSSAAAAISTAQGPIIGTAAVPLVALKEGAFSLNGIMIGPSLAAADTASTVTAFASSIAKAAAVNLKSDQTGVTATINATEVAGASMTAGVAAGTATINGVSIVINTTADAASTRAAVVSAINAQEGLTGVTAVDSGTDKGGVSLVAKDGRNITLNLGTVTAAQTGLQAAAPGTAQTYAGSITLNSDKAIVITSNQNGALGQGGIKDAGLTVGTFQAQTAYASTTAYSPVVSGATAFTAGDFTINGSTIGASLASSDTKSYSYTTVGAIASKSASGIAKAAAINELTAQTGVTATANATTVEGNVGAMTFAAATSGTLQINGVSTAVISVGTVSAAANRKTVVDAINAISGQTGVTAIDSNDDTKGVSLVAADGRNITAIQTSGGGLASATTGLGFTMTAAAAAGAGTSTELDARTFTSTLTLSSASAFTIAKGSTDAGTAPLGLKSGEYGAGRNGGALSLANLLTAEGATAAMTSLDNSLNTVEALRADMGTMQNRFQSSADSLANSISNQTGAQDQIIQSDFIADTAKLTSQEFLASVSGSTLAKANALQATMLQALIPR